MTAAKRYWVMQSELHFIITGVGLHYGRNLRQDNSTTTIAILKATLAAMYRIGT